MQRYIGRSSTAFLHRPTSKQKAVSSAEDVLSLLAPQAMKGDLRKRLQQEQVQTAVDLAELDKEDLRDLGLGMVERRRVLRWAASTEPSLGPMFGAEGRPIHALEKAQSDLDLWFSLANSTYFPVLMRQLRESLSGSESLAADSEIRESNLRSRNIRENMLEEHFDLTPERIKEIFEQVSQGEKIQTAQQLMEGLSRIGVTCSDLAPLSSAFDLVGRRSGPGCHSGMHADELDVILSRVKLAQLLGRGEGSVSWSVPSGRLTLVDYTMQDAVMQEGRSSGFFGVTTRSRGSSGGVEAQDLQAEKLLHFFFGHRSHSSSFGKGPVQRWLHLRGCHLMLLMALTVKYRLSPLGVEDIIEQGPTKVDQHGVNIFITLDSLAKRMGGGAVDQLYVKNSGRLGVAPVQIGSSHVTLILSAPHRPDTLTLGDARVAVLARPFSMGHEDGGSPSYSRAGMSTRTGPASWLSEVSLIRLQLAVVSRRLRNARNMLRRLEGMVPGDASLESRLSGYLQDVSDDVDGSLEDANHLTEKCNELSNAYDAALNREQSSQRRVAKEGRDDGEANIAVSFPAAQEAERIEQVKQNRHAQKLNDILFVLTTATALFAPVQNWMAGRTSELTKTISRSVAFPDLHLSTGSTGEMGANAASIIADTAKKLLLERVSSPFPCSRLALAETQSDASDGGSERAPEATSVEATSCGQDRQPANVAEFHKASRLHFLGTWRERFERWRAEGGAGPRSSHDDMDCFFASVATRDMDAPGEEVTACHDVPDNVLMRSCDESALRVEGFADAQTVQTDWMHLQCGSGTYTAGGQVGDEGLQAQWCPKGLGG
eukprot:g13316.t1